MQKEPLETAELQAFVKIVEVGSITRAAEILGQPRATVTRRLSRLEERLGLRLIKRSTRSLSVTDAGQAFYAHACDVLESMERAMASVCKAHHSPVLRGSVRASVPPMRDERFDQMVLDFIRAHPEVKLSIHYTGSFVDMHRDEYDVVLRAGYTYEESQLISRTLFRSALMAVASSEYLKEHGAPKRVEELSRHRCLMGFRRGELPQTHWPLLDGGQVAVEGSFFASDLVSLKRVTCAGVGIAMLPQHLVSDELARGELVAVLGEVLGADVRMALLYRERELMPPQVRAFIDAVLGWATGLDEVSLGAA